MQLGSECGQGDVVLPVVEWDHRILFVHLIHIEDELQAYAGENESTDLDLPDSQDYPMRRPHCIHFIRQTIWQQRI